MNLHVIQAAVPEILTQLAGFLVVFFVLKRFAFGPIFKVMDDRRAKVEGEFRSIEESKKSIANLESEYRSKIAKIEDEARLKIQEAARQGNLLAQDIQQKAREDSEKMIGRAKTEIENDLAKAKIALREQVVELSMLATENVMREKVDAAGHKKLVDRFLDEAGRLN